MLPPARGTTDDPVNAPIRATIVGNPDTGVNLQAAALTSECITLFHNCMTMLSFRVPDQDAEAAGEWAVRLGMKRSRFLREALHSYLLRLRAEEDARRWLEHPPSEEETSLSKVADWGPAEDWRDWDDAAR